jgi:ArsR family transcriptional regulator
VKPQQKLHKLQAEVIGAMGHPIRLAIIDFLSSGEQCVCDIASAVGAERSNVSRHLAVLYSAGLVSCRKEGLKQMYSLSAPCVLKFLSCITDVVRQQANQRRDALRCC